MTRLSVGNLIDLQTACVKRPTLDAYVRAIGPIRTRRIVSSNSNAGVVGMKGVVGVDPKAELYNVTARARLQKGFKVARLDPFGCTSKPSHSVNWLDGIDPKEKNCVAESAQLADALVVRRNTDDSHWDTQAAYLLQGLILHVATLPENERHMGTVRQLLTSPIEELVKRLKGLQTETRGCGVIAKMANTFLAKADRERSGVLSTAQGHTAFLDDPQILATLSRTDFSFAGLKDERLSVYLTSCRPKRSAHTTATYAPRSTSPWVP